MNNIHNIIFNFCNKILFFSSTTMAPISSCVGTLTCAFIDASVAAERACTSYLLASNKASTSSSSPNYIQFKLIYGHTISFNFKLRSFNIIFISFFFFSFICFFFSQCILQQKRYFFLQYTVHNTWNA